jgi:hypothetical protein
VISDVGVGHCGSWSCRSSRSGRCLAVCATAVFVDGRGSRHAAGRMPPAGAGVPAASGSRSWCRRRGGTAQHWPPPHRWWPGRHRAAPRTAPAAPRSAGPGLGRAKSPPEQAIEHVFEILSAMLPTATGRIVGAHWGHRAPVYTGQQRTIRVWDGPGRRLVVSSRRRSGARLFRALRATVSARPGQVVTTFSTSSRPALRAAAWRTRLTHSSDPPTRATRPRGPLSRRRSPEIVSSLGPPSEEQVGTYPAPMGTARDELRIGGDHAKRALRREP